MTIDFKLNGDASSLPKGSKLSDLLAALELSNTPVNIKVNGKRLMRKDWQQEIQSGDRIELNLAIPHSCVTVQMQN